jgi:beta-lactam-binding protein with PASTA domain
MKKIMAYIFLSLSIVISIAYLVLTLLNSGNNLKPLEAIVGSALLSIFTVSFVIMCLFVINSKVKGKLYMYITSSILTLFLIFNLLVNIQVLKLPTQSTVNDFTNVSISDALVWATGHEIKVEQIYEPSDTIPMHHIINQTITAGTLTKDISKIGFTISTGPNYDKQIIVPNMLGWKIDDVLSFINDNFLNNITINYETSDEAKDAVIFQDRNGALRRSDAIKLTFSLGSRDSLAKMEIIDLVNKKQFDATLWLMRYGFRYDIEYQFSDTVERHRVISQSITKGTTIDPNVDRIKLVISKGKKIIVPDLMQMDIATVTKWIMDNKLAIKFSDRYDDKIALGKLISSDYKAGSEIEEGTLITVVTSKGPLKMEEFTSLYSFREWANNYGIPYQETYQFNDTIPSGQIISFSHQKNQIISNNDAIQVVVSQGKAVTIPNFYGQSKTQITSTCHSIGLTCYFVYGSYGSVAKDRATSQSKRSGSEVISGTSISITLSKGPALKYTLILQESLYTYGNATATVASLKSYLAANYPGVTFNIAKVADNSANSGLPHPDSPYKTGSIVEQGKSYSIWVVE